MSCVYALLLLSLFSSCQAEDFMEQVVQELKPSLLLLRYDFCPEMWLQRLLGTTQMPVVLQSMDSALPLSVHFSQVLQLICLPSAAYPVAKVERNLNGLREAKHVFYIATGNSSSSSCSRSTLFSLLTLCNKLKILNVVALAEDALQVYYRYRPYPRFALDQRRLSERPFFQTHLRNMYGESITVLPDQKHPRTIYYTDWRNGKQILAGSVGRFVNTLAWKLNATIVIPRQVKPGEFIHFSEVEPLLEAYNIDVPATVTQLTRAEQLPLTSFPFELTKICLMIPLARQIPIRDIYLILNSPWHIFYALAIVFSLGLLLSLHKRLAGQPAGLVDLLLNDVVLRGLLGQSFGSISHRSIHISWIYLMLALLGLNISSMHEAALGTLLTNPPKYFQARSFADIERSQIPVLINMQDSDNSCSLDEIHSSLRVTCVNSTDFNTHRDMMNASYAYFASRLKWTLLSEQQKYFPHEVFLYSKDACIMSFTYMVFQLPKHSWFREPITKLIMDARDFGLFQHWVDMHFYDMAAADLLSFSDPMQREPQRLKAALRLEDLQWIWIAYGALLLLATIVFALEVVVNVLAEMSCWTR